MGRRTWLGLAAAAGLALGCGHSRNGHLPNDPLLLGKSPVEARPSSATSGQLARQEPQPPEGPAVAFAAAARTRDRATVEAIPALNTPLRPIPVLPASNPRPSEF
jgi:hypothetical protein